MPPDENDDVLKPLLDDGDDLLTNEKRQAIAKAIQQGREREAQLLAKIDALSAKFDHSMSGNAERQVLEQFAVFREGKTDAQKLISSEANKRLTAIRKANKDMSLEDAAAQAARDTEQMFDELSGDEGTARRAFSTPTIGTGGAAGSDGGEFKTEGLKTLDEACEALTASFASDLKRRT